jgi:hypothetical protein
MLIIELTAKAWGCGLRVITSLKAGVSFEKITTKKGLQTQAFFIFKVQTNYCFIAL